MMVQQLLQRQRRQEQLCTEVSTQALGPQFLLVSGVKLFSSTSRPYLRIRCIFLKACRPSTIQLIAQLRVNITSSGGASGLAFWPLAGEAQNPHHTITLSLACSMACVGLLAKLFSTAAKYKHTWYEQGSPAESLVKSQSTT